MTSIVPHPSLQLALAFDLPDRQICRICGISKLLAEFYYNHGRATRLCKQCRKEQKQEGKLGSNRKLDNGPVSVCRTCGIAKPLSSFPQRASRVSGRYGSCLECWRRKKKEYKQRAKISQDSNAKADQQERLVRQKSRLRTRYGVTLEELLRVYSEQAGLCAICQRQLAPPPAKNTQVDHDHETLAVRGLLCFNCNIGLGYFKDDVSYLERAAYYLRKGNSHES